jgi:hypothetical protein
MPTYDYSSDVQECQLSRRCERAMVRQFLVDHLAGRKVTANKSAAKVNASRDAGLADALSTPEPMPTSAKVSGALRTASYGLFLTDRITLEEFTEISTADCALCCHCDYCLNGSG